MSSSNSNITVGITGTTLVVSFLNADVPRIWRTDLAHLQTAALEVQDNQGKYILVMKPSGAPAEEIGTFSSKKEAVEALQSVTDAMLQGKTTAPKKKSGSWLKKILKFLLWLLVAFIVLVTLVNIFGRHAPPGQNSYTKAPAAQSGVPTPADDILGK